MTDDQFEKLAQLIQNSHAELIEQIIALRAEMHEGFASIQTELRDIRERLVALEEKVAQHSGYAKEIDHLLSRIAFIEQKLGIQSPILAE